MAKIIRTSKVDNIPIPRKINRQITQGFDAISDAHTFRFLRKRRLSAPESKLPDLTGLECYVNEIGLNSEDHDLHTLLGMEILIAVLNKWASFDKGLVLRGIISVSAEFTHLTFHVDRPNESYLESDLDSYEQPIMTCDSNSPINKLSDLILLVQSHRQKHGGE